MLDAARHIVLSTVARRIAAGVHSLDEVVGIAEKNGQATI